MKTIISMIFTTLVTSFASAGNVQINCTGADGAGRKVLISLIDVTGDGFGSAFGVLTAKTDSGVNTISTRAWLVGREGKMEDEGIGFNKDLYIETDDVALNLDKTGRQRYTGSICGPRNNIKIAGIQFGQDDCFDLVCSSKGLSTLK
ncbi:hypothetical protein ACES2I_05480 [Bdellovibrio bacteriovorus]|uniref:hypothetical protein n=1 Tax=Bdellovibrio bacteriovorus TaxID=959 RepID=UPI0035A5B935